MPECTVCYNETKNKLYCDHYLCEDCKKSITKKPVPGEEIIPPKCPICATLIDVDYYDFPDAQEIKLKQYFMCCEECEKIFTDTISCSAEKNKKCGGCRNYDVKTCPDCFKSIMKDRGCNHMICVCGYHFCWICLEKWDGHKDFFNCENLILVGTEIKHYKCFQTNTFLVRTFKRGFLESEFRYYNNQLTKFHSKRFYCKGKLHREGEPAVIFYSKKGSITNSFYYKNGEIV